MTAGSSAPEPRWLSDVEQRAWRAWIDSSRRIAAATDRQLKHDHDLSGDDYEVLVRLSEAPERRIRMSELATSVRNSPSRLSQRVDRMAARGLVGRDRCEEDGRVWWVVLTDEGFAALEAAAPSHVEEVRRQFIDRLDASDVDALARILPKLVAPAED